MGVLTWRPILSFLATVVLLPLIQPRAAAALGWWEKEFEPAGLGLGGPETPVTLFTQPLQNTLLTLNTITPQRVSRGLGGGEWTHEQYTGDSGREPHLLRAFPPSLENLGGVCVALRTDRQKRGFWEHLGSKYDAGVC